MNLVYFKQFKWIIFITTFPFLGLCQDYTFKSKTFRVKSEKNTGEWGKVREIKELGEEDYVLFSFYNDFGFIFCSNLDEDLYFDKAKLNQKDSDGDIYSTYYINDGTVFTLYKINDKYQLYGKLKTMDICWEGEFKSVWSSMTKPNIDEKNIVSDETTQTSNSNSINLQTTQIGSQVWTTNNLDIKRFRNGDLIKIAKNKEEWLSACSKKEPICAFYNFDDGNKKFGLLYNQFAIIDSRGLAPDGYRIPNRSDWKTLMNTVGTTNSKSLKSTNSWESYYDAIECSNCKSWSDEYKKKVTCHSCKDTRQIGKKNMSGNGNDKYSFNIKAYPIFGNYDLTNKNQKNREYDETIFWSTSFESGLFGDNIPVVFKIQNFSDYLNLGRSLEGENSGLYVRLLKE